MSLVSLLVLIGLITLLICYPYIKDNLQDINPAFLEHQASVGPTRRKGESAVYRSVNVPHGLSLTGGLRIRVGYKLRDGCLKDVWSRALGGRKADGKAGTVTKTADQTKFVFTNGVKLTIGQINTLLHRIAEKTTRLTDKPNIGIFSDFASPESIFLALSCFFVSEKTLVSYNSLPKKPVEDLDLIFVDAEQYGKVSAMGFKKIVVIGRPGIPSIVSSDEKTTQVFDFKTKIADVGGTVEPTYKYLYDPDTQYMKFNNKPYCEINGSREVDFFQRSFVSSIASRLMSLPKAFIWSKDDSLLVVASPMNGESKNFLLMNVLCGILSGVRQISIVADSDINSLNDVLKIDRNVTILTAKDQVLQRVVSQTPVSLFKKFLIGRSEYLNSTGVFNTLGRFVCGLRLKLVYSMQSSTPLNSTQYNTLRSCLGSRIIREAYTPLTMGPIFKTNIYESRVLADTKLKGHRFVELGVPADCLELKLKKNKDEDRDGELYARGYSVGKGVEGKDYDKDFWVPLGITGQFAPDGCFYAYE